MPSPSVTAAPPPAVRWHRRPLTWVWVALLAWTAGWTVIRWREPVAGGGWHFFADGSRMLFGHEGLGLFATHPNLQIGPLTFLVAWPIQWIGPGDGRELAMVLMSLVGPVLLAAVWRLVPADRRSPERLLLCGLVFIIVWSQLATHSGHLDDLMALCFGVAALHASARNKPVVAGLMVACAADCKPWALAFAALLLLPTPRATIVSLATCAAGVAAVWLPFVLYDHRTLDVTRFAIPNSRASGLRAIGYHGRRLPHWDRPLQIGTGVVLGAIAVLRGRWYAVILLAMAARVAFDPQVYGYYSAGVMVGAAVFDLIGTRWRVPVASILGACTLWLPQVMFTHGMLGLTKANLGQLRVVLLVAVVALVFCAPAARPAQSDPA